MQRPAHDDGFSLVEMVLAVFLLGILALATLPLFATVTQTSAYNRDLGTANGYANSVITELRARFPDGVAATTCTSDANGSLVASLTSINAKTGVLTVPAPEGSRLDARVSMPAACPATGYPLAQTVTVIVFPKGEPAADSLVTVSTQIYVGAR